MVPPMAVRAGTDVQSPPRASLVPQLANSAQRPPAFAVLAVKAVGRRASMEHEGPELSPLPVPLPSQEPEDMAQEKPPKGHVPRTTKQ
jgi:hypothetical protein